MLLLFLRGLQMLQIVIVLSDLSTVPRHNASYIEYTYAL